MWNPNTLSPTLRRQHLLSTITINFDMNELTLISRATSVSRASRNGLTISRNPPLIRLIKKNGAPHDLKPPNVLIERFVAWTAIVK